MIGVFPIGYLAVAQITAARTWDDVSEQGEAWTAVTAQSEAWTEVTDQPETWTPV